MKPQNNSNNKTKNIGPIPILIALVSLLLLLATAYNMEFSTTIPKTSNTTIITPINLVITYGTSQVKEWDFDTMQTGNQGRTIVSIEARVPINSTTIDGNQLNNTLQVLFDGVIKKQIDLKISEVITSPFSMGIITITSEEIQEWDANQNTTHTITFRVPEARKNSTYEYHEYLWKPSEEIVKIKVTTQNTHDYTITSSGSQYITEDIEGKIRYNGASASSAIQTAFDLVIPSQTILIKSAIYNLTEAITISKDNITINGEKGTILKASKELGSILTSQGNQTNHIVGLTLENLSFDCSLKAAGPSFKWIDNSTFSNIQISNTKQTKLTNGLEVQGSAKSIIRGITITGCYINNIYASGIAIEFITDSKIDNNTLIDCAQYYPSGGAILANDGCQRITVQNNKISGRSDNDGIYLGTSVSFAKECLISGNMINLRLFGTGGGAKFAGSGIKVYALNSELRENTIDWNGTPNVFGISNWGMGNNIHNNTISNADIGYGSQKTYYNGGSTVTDNRINGCNKGMEILQKGSLVTRNTITDCRVPISAVYGNTVNGNIIN